jgi:hypothetical protein
MVVLECGIVAHLMLLDNEIDFIWCDSEIEVAIFGECYYIPRQESLESKDFPREIRGTRHCSTKTIVRTCGSIPNRHD